MHSDYSGYEDLIINYNIEVEKMLDKSIEHLLEALNLTKEIFEASL